MTHWIVIISTSYSVEEYLIPVHAGECIETATEQALASIAFCEDYRIEGCIEVNRDYMDAVKRAKERYKALTGETVADSFTCGDYATLTDILSEMMER